MGTGGMVSDALVLGLFGAAPLVLAAGGAHRPLREGGTNGAWLAGNGPESLGTVTHRDRVPSRARGDG